MSKAIDHAGVRYGRIVGIRPTDKSRNEQIVWLWKCDCGTEFEAVAGNYVHRGWSSGCRACAKASKAKATGDRARVHGMRNTPEYKSWRKIKERCHCPSNKDYPSYGAIGITMCDEWLNDFQCFFDHIGPKPKDGQRWTVDRIDNDKGYEPGNVRWATDKGQARNKKKLMRNKTGYTGVHIDEKTPGNFYARLS